MKKNKCPRCGKLLDDDTGVCWDCGYSGIKRAELCPKCGEPLVKGVCYRCGYSKKKKRNVCPVCRGKMIGGRCEDCGYKKSKKNKCLFIFVVVLVVSAYLLGRCS